MANNRILVIGDTHFPFHSKSAYSKLLRHIKFLDPTHVIQIGDLLDQYVFSKYSRYAGITPKDDITYGLELAKDMWEHIGNIVPGAKRYQLLGNHDVRIAKRISEKLPELSDFFSHKDIYKFDGVKVFESDRDYLEIGGIIFVHGWLSKSIDHAKYFNKPTVHGHRHRPCIEYDRHNLWSMDVGFLADANSLPLQYTANKFSKWTTSLGFIDKDGPRIITL